MLKKAFSLLELSVVIAVIAILISGVTIATNLVENANLMVVMNEVEKYSRGIINFKTKYNAYPGDMSNAYAVFGSGCAGNSSANCNGDGDGQIEWFVDTNDNEYLKVFHHMYLAGVISEVINDSTFGLGLVDFNGTTCSSHGGSFPGKTTPTLAIENLTIGLIGKEHIMIGNYRCGYPMYGGLTPSQAEKYDLKYDDGVRDSGIFISYDGLNVTAGDCTTSTGSKYNLAKTNKACRTDYFVFKGGL